MRLTLLHGSGNRPGLEIEAGIIADGGASTEALRRRLAEALARNTLSQPDVTVRLAGDLPMNPGSGKLRRVIPLAQIVPNG